MIGTVFPDADQWPYVAFPELRRVTEKSGEFSPIKVRNKEEKIKQ
jgi:hypothetical protein